MLSIRKKCHRVTHGRSCLQWRITALFLRPTNDLILRNQCASGRVDAAKCWELRSRSEQRLNRTSPPARARRHTCSCPQCRKYLDLGFCAREADGRNARRCHHSDLDARQYAPRIQLVRGGGGANLYLQAADGTGTATRLTDGPNAQHPTGFTSDGRQVVLNESTRTQQGDIRLLTLTPTPQVTPLVETRFDERGGVLSPNGRWLAYESNRSGAYEIYVQPFPLVDGGLWPVSIAGGVQPLWARNGRELFYLAPDGALMKVAVDARGTELVCQRAGPTARRTVLPG
jgi:hypothetical protein